MRCRKLGWFVALVLTCAPIVAGCSELSWHRQTIAPVGGKQQTADSPRERELSRSAKKEKSLFFNEQSHEIEQRLSRPVEDL